MSMRTVLVGCGGISKAWLAMAAKMDDVEIVGLVDLARDAAEAKAKQFGLTDAIVDTDMAAALEKTKPEAVFDCTTPEAHARVTLEAFARGCHVLGEKPMADSMANARKMVAAAREAGKIYAVGQQRRYNPQIARLRRFIESGAIGPLTTVNCDFYIGAHFGGFRAQMDHVLLIDMAIHTFDAARFISGADPLSAYCHEWNPRGSWYAHGACAQAIFEMTDGIVINYRGSWCSEGLITPWESQWRVIGENGSVAWDGRDGLRAQVVGEIKGLIPDYIDVEVPPAEGAPKQDDRYLLMRDFVDCVRSGGAPKTVCADNIKSLAMVFGAIDSAESAKKTPIAP